MRSFVKYSVFLLTFLGWSLAASSQVAIGQWRDHLAYGSLHKVCLADKRVYGTADKGLFHYDRQEQTLSRMSKVDGLSDVGISTVAYDPVSRYLVVAYNNANVDVVYDDKVYNISDIKRSSISGDKGIRNIRFQNHKAYLACTFGIVVVDLERREIAETYYIGTGGAYLAVNDIAFTDSVIIAATATGLRTAQRSSRFLNIASNWAADTSSLLRGVAVDQIELNGTTLLVSADYYGDGSRCIFKFSLHNGTPVEQSTLPWLSGAIRSLRSANNRVAVSYRDSVTVYNSAYAPMLTVGDVDWLEMQANDAVCATDGTLWIAHNWAGLVAVSPSGALLHSLTPTSPVSDNVYRLVPYKDRMMVCPGGRLTTYEKAYLGGNIYTFQKEQWQQLDQSSGIAFSDVLDVAVNPKNKKQMLAAAWGCGIVDITDNKPVALYDNNSTAGVLHPFTSGNYSSLLTGAVAYDSKGNAWMLNALVDEALVKLGKDGTWTSFNTSAMVGTASGRSEVDKLICDSVRGYKWFFGRANRIYVHDGENRMAYVDPNNGSKLETSTVTCLVQDHDGDLWIGTNKGLKLLGNCSNAFGNGGSGEKSPVTAMNITISNDQFAEYLMAYESVTCIAVDGANRKWVGTASGGLYLISPTGQDELIHFTAANSPLFSDKIIAVAVQPESGEVFIGTDKGLQSYRGTATYADAYPDDDVHVFPNPVRPDYDGSIAIKGFTRNALVHITDVAGHVVFSTTAKGGQAIWNRRTNSGRPVASGTYFVFASDKNGKMRSVAKVLVIR